MGVGDHSAKEFVGHGDGPVDQVAQCVGKLGIHPFHHQLPGDHAVVFKGHFMQYKIAHSVHPEEIRQLVRVEYIPFGFAHLPLAL